MGIIKNELINEIEAVMENNYSDEDIQDFSCWINEVLINEPQDDLTNDERWEF